MLNPKAFLEQGKHIPIIDVRSPAEYAQGHIPTAINIALFSNDERAQVGTRYKQAGREFAIQLGLELVGNKLANFAKEIKKHCKQKKALVHCWRGGMRSAAMAWLFSFVGIECQLLEGGYKAYRAYIRESLSTPQPLRILGGYTGSGKTDILFALAQLGEQIIDLEGIAHHKGSAFGAIGESAQPTNEQFENNLANRWLDLNPLLPVWLEDESVTMGSCGIPHPLFKRMRNAHTYVVQVPTHIRINKLVSDYAQCGEAPLQAAVERISKKLGGLRTQEAIKALKQKNYKNAAAICLKYYDKAYKFGIQSREEKNSQQIHYLKINTFDMQQIAQQLICTANSIESKTQL